jgi:hypothetical protein
MGSIIRPDLGKVVWMAAGFLVLPRLVRMVGR